MNPCTISGFASSISPLTWITRPSVFAPTLKQANVGATGAVQGVLAGQQFRADDPIPGRRGV
jgi:hypothetical protein